MHKLTLPGTVAMSYCRLVTLLFFGALLLPQAVAAKPLAQSFDVTEQCFGVADESNIGSNGADTLVRINRTNGRGFEIGATGTSSIEAIAFGPDDILYAANGDRLVTLDYANNGKFIAKPALFGKASGTLGAIDLTDVDGLSYDIHTKTLYGVHRRQSSLTDLLFKIDLTTGAHIPGAFQGQGYVEVVNVKDSTGATLSDVDDIAVDPTTGLLYAAMNSGGTSGVLVLLDAETGATKPLGEFRYASGLLAGQIVDDIEGLSFFNDGLLYGSTGNNGPDADDKNQLFRLALPLQAGAPVSATVVGAFPPDRRDFEALACLTAKVFINLRKFTNAIGQPPADAETPPGPQITADAPVIWTYVMTNTGMLTLTNITLTDDKLGLIGPDGRNNCPPPNTILGPGASITCQATGVAQLGQYVNNGLVTAVTQAGVITPSKIVSDSNLSHYIGLGVPRITLQKFTNGADVETPTGPKLLVGTEVIWTYDVRNSGAIELINIVVTDDQEGIIPCPHSTLRPGGHMVCKTQGVVQPGLYTNLATVTALPASGPPTPVTHADHSYHFGGVPSSCMEGRLWSDDNGNGGQNSSEDGIANVTVNLLDSSNSTVVASQISNATGNYRFADLMAGVYTVVVNTATPALAGAKPTFDADGLITEHRATITLAEYECPARLDFGYQFLASALSGRVWYDDNRDGKDLATATAPAETGIVSVSVKLFDGNNNLLLTSETDINGYYRFGDLAPGGYRIEVDRATLPPNAVPTYDRTPPPDHRATTTLRRNENQNDLHFGYQLPGTILGLLWLDNDCSEQRDSIEQGMANITLHLLNGSNQRIASTQTSASGVYSFTNLPIGTYTITVETTTLPADAQPSVDPDDKRDQQTMVRLQRNETRSNVDFGYHGAVSSISGRLWIDANNNGAPDPNEGIPNVTVELLDNGYTPLAQTVTNADGSYLFAKLAAAVYIVRVSAATLPGGITPFYEADDKLDQTVTVILGPCEQRGDLHFGYTLLPPGSIHGRVLYETGGGIDGVRVDLYTLANTLVTSATTAADGRYGFTNVTAGDYLVKVYTATLPPGLQPIRDPDPMADHMTQVTLSPGGALSAIDFVYGSSTLLCSIYGTVWVDENANGIHDGADRGIPGVKVDLYTSDDRLITTTVTNANGEYLFANPAPGGYSIRIDPTTLPPKYKPLPDADGTPDHRTDVVVGANHCRVQRDFRYQPGLPGLELTLSINGEAADRPPGPVVVIATTVTWRYQITNSGALPIQQIRLHDDNGTPETTADDRLIAENVELAPGQSLPFTLTGIAQSGHYTYVATATGEPSDGSPGVQATDRGHYRGVSSIIDVDLQLNNLQLTPSPGQCVQTPGLLTWSYRLTNYGKQPLINLQVTDSQLGAIQCPALRLEPGAAMTCTASATASEGAYQSTVTATGQPVNSNNQPEGDILRSQPVNAFYVGWRTGVELEKAVNSHPADQPNDKWVIGDAPVAFTYWVTNTGASTLTQPTVSDSDPALNVQCPQLAALLPGASMLCTATGTRLDGNYSHMATFSAQPTEAAGLRCGAPLIASDPAYYHGESGGPTLRLTQEQDERDIGALHRVTAILFYTATQRVVANEPIYFQISGLHTVTGVVTTTAAGEALFVYPGTQNFMANNASQGVDQILAWSDLNDNRTLDLTGGGADPAAAVDVTWHRVDIGICHDEGGTVADPVRRVTVKVTRFGENPKANCNPPQAPVQGIRIGMAVTGGTQRAPEIIAVEDGQPVTFSYVTTAPRLLAAQSDPALAGAAAAISTTAAAQPLADTDLINVWVDILRNGLLDGPEPFDLAEEVTAVELATFALQAEGAQVIIRWATGVELDTVGFNLYRSLRADGDYVLVNDRFIGALGEGYGASYEWVDRPPTSGLYYYRLEAINNQNERTTYPPQSVWVDGPSPTDLPNRLYLPAILR